jgi:hypothetical protein
MKRSYRGIALLGAMMGLGIVALSGCLPPAVPEEQAVTPAEPFEAPPEAVRPMVISPVNITPPPYAHRMVPVRDRNYRLRSSGSVGEYNTEIRRQVMRLSLKELEREMASTGWGPYMTMGPVPEHLIPDPPRGDYNADTHREWLESRERSWFWTDYDWPGMSGGSNPGTDQSSLRSAWVAQVGGGGAGGGGGGAASGLPGGMMGGPGPMMGGAMLGPPGGGGAGTGAGGPSMMSSAPMLPE